MRVQPVRLLDVKLLSGAIKILLVTYASDLLFGDLRPEYAFSPSNMTLPRVMTDECEPRRIFLHHFFTFALLFVGQLAAHECEGAPAGSGESYISRLD